MAGLEKKVETYRENLYRIISLRKKLIDAEISLISLKKELNLSTYDWKRLIHAKYPEKEIEVQQLINRTPKYILHRDKTYKSFQKTLLEKDIRLLDVAKALNINQNRILRILKGVNTNRDIDTEKAIEQFLGKKIFNV